MQTVLIAGGAGFIGSHLSRRLFAEGNEVICVDNLITGSRRNIADLEGKPNFTYLEGDITSQDFIKETLSKVPSVTAIFHLASPASPNKKSPRSYISFPIETMLVNSVGTYHLLEIARKYRAKFLFASTSEVYGDPEVSPQPESYFGNVNPNGSRSVYDEAKRFGEAMTSAYFRKYSVDIRTVRIFNTYGPSMQPDDGRVISNFITQALHKEPLTIYGSGEQTRSFCYIDDMVNGLVSALFCEGTENEVINIGNPDERTIKEIATVIKNLTGSSSEIVYEALPEDDPKVRRPSIEKAQRLLKWSPTVFLEDGLRKTISYFKNV
jgi:nucleoside-diphosphate-sugar epimerase